jgi:hypothetical protein
MPNHARRRQRTAEERRRRVARIRQAQAEIDTVTPATGFFGVMPTRYPETATGTTLTMDHINYAVATRVMLDQPITFDYIRLEERLATLREATKPTVKKIKRNLPDWF